MASISYNLSYFCSQTGTSDKVAWNFFWKLPEFLYPSSENIKAQTILCCYIDRSSEWLKTEVDRRTYDSIDRNYFLNDKTLLLSLENSATSHLYIFEKYNNNGNLASPLRPFLSVQYFSFRNLFDHFQPVFPRFVTRINKSSKCIGFHCSVWWPQLIPHHSSQKPKREIRIRRETL